MKNDFEMQIDKEVEFLKKLKTRFTNDLEYIAVILDMHKSGMIKVDSFIAAVTDVVTVSKPKVNTPIVTSRSIHGC